MVHGCLGRGAVSSSGGVGWTVWPWGGASPTGLAPLGTPWLPEVPLTPMPCPPSAGSEVAGQVLRYGQHFCLGTSGGFKDKLVSPLAGLCGGGGGGGWEGALIPAFPLWAPLAPASAPSPALPLCLIRLASSSSPSFPGCLDECPYVLQGLGCVSVLGALSGTDSGLSVSTWPVGCSHRIQPERPCRQVLTLPCFPGGV